MRRRGGILCRAQLPLALFAAGCRPIAPLALRVPAPAEAPQRWQEEIEQFRRQDRETPFAPGGVVFVGSSSIRFWSTLAADMAPIPVLNRGFGGSKLADAIAFAHELVGVHRPSVVLVFSGTNDIDGDAPRSAAEVCALFLELVARLRAEDRELAIAYVAITPTRARERHVAIVREANRRIRLACAGDPRLEFIDPTPELLDAEGRPDPRFFRADGLHLDEDGYAVWTRCIRPVIERLYRREQARRAALPARARPEPEDRP